jgi:hypothetical protein
MHVLLALARKHGMQLDCARVHVFVNSVPIASESLGPQGFVLWS